ncbi:hypothetical protein PIB30_010876 [Stylosanthes scabra]|uniref:Uncharacterized protein n=1 Tax=Stylosanthes scabra TaxID=79078 RepID=A0ABU6S561_9FABA|nr:hypothetical protein [Stylosanthes scabra]
MRVREEEIHQWREKEKKKAAVTERGTLLLLLSSTLKKEREKDDVNSEEEKRDAVALSPVLRYSLSAFQVSAAPLSTREPLELDGAYCFVTDQKFKRLKFQHSHSRHSVLFLADLVAEVVGKEDPRSLTLERKPKG